MSDVIRISPNLIKTWKSEENKHVIVLDEGDKTIVATFSDWQIDDLLESIKKDRESIGD